MKARTTLLVLSALGLVAACSSKATDVTPDAKTVAPTVSESPTIHFDMAVTVPAGGEIHKCKYVRAPDAESYVVTMAHEYSPGSHHLLVFRTDKDKLQPGEDATVDCNEGALSPMKHVRGILYGSQEAKQSGTLPQGIGLYLKPNEVLLVQAHYLNATAKPIDAKIAVDFKTAPADTIAHRAGVLFFYDPFIYVPARATASASMRCVIPNDIKLLSGFSHTHKRGSTFAAFMDEKSDVLAEKPFYTSKDWEHPEGLAAPIDVKAGSRIRFNCNYDNTKNDREFYQGQSAEDNEMCLFSGIYYPEMGLQTNLCMTGFDRIGVGTATCAEALKCAQSCPPGTSSGNAQLGAVGNCLQKCVATSCPTATTPLIAQFQCVQKSCKDACATPGAAACTTCVTEKCPQETGACASHTCP